MLATSKPTTHDRPTRQCAGKVGDRVEFDTGAGHPPEQLLKADIAADLLGAVVGSIPGISSWIPARRDSRLRYARQERRAMYLGQWILDWLAATPTQAKGGRRG